MTKEVAVDPLNQALAKMLGVVTDGAGKVVDLAGLGAEKAYNFLSTEIPDVIRELLYWKFAESVIYCLLSLLCLVLMVMMHITFHKIFKKQDNEYDRDNVRFAWSSLGGLASVILTILALVCFNITWLKIWIAPKIYLLEYASQLLKG